MNAKKPKKQAQPTTVFSGNQIYGVKWDAQAVEALQTAAEGLLVNARAFEKMMDVFKAQHIEIECLVKVG